MLFIHLDNDILGGFLASFVMILLTEIGDKTFFMTTIFARDYSKSSVIIGSSLALILMTVLSAAFGVVVYKYIPRLYMLFISTAMFLWFSISFLKEYLKTESSENETDGLHDLEKGSSQNANNGTYYRNGMIKSFSSVFIAEWGDRSQISTITLASTYDIYGVIFGASLGHFICTLLAANLGHMVSTRISSKTMELLACILFALFAVMNVLEIVF